MDFKSFITKRGYTAESYSELEVTKQAELQTEFLSEVANKLENKATKEELNVIKDEVSKATTKEELKKATDDIEALALKVAGIVEKGGKGGAKRTIKSIINEQIEANKGKDARDRKLEVAIKADILFNLVATAAGGNFPSDDANVDTNILFATALDLGFAQRLSREATILNKVAASAVPLKIGEALSVEVPYDESGAPVRTTEGKAKPVVAFKFKKEKKEAEKVPVVFYISEEFMNRADYLVSKIQNYIVLLLSEVLEEFVFDSTSGILSYGVAPNATLLGNFSISTPNTFDALNSVASVMVDQKFKPDTIVLNTIDVAQMFSDKGTDGHYNLANGGSVKLIEGTNRLMIGNKTFDLIEVNSDILAVGSFAMIDWSKLEFGLGDMISKTNPYSYMRDNVVENIIEIAFAVMEPSNYSGAVVTDAISDVTTIISA